MLLTYLIGIKSRYFITLLYYHLIKGFIVYLLSCCVPGTAGNTAVMLKAQSQPVERAHGFTRLTDCQGVISLAQVGSVRDEVQQRRGELIRGSGQR